MSFFLRPISFLFFFFLTFFIFQDSTFASEEFFTSYKINYTVYESGLVNVEQEVNLTNRLLDIYATQYSLTIGSNNLSRVRAWDEFGPLEPQIEVSENKTVINLNFKEKVIGKDKGRTFHLVYQSPDFATVKGKVLEVGIPLLAETDDLVNYQVSLHTPLSYGRDTYMLPHPASVSEGGSFRHYQFNQQTLKSSQGIMATFGQSQIFDFSLNFHLANEQKRKVITQVALPSDTPFQRVAITLIEPKPINVEADLDGNWLASYELEPGKKLDLVVKGTTNIFISPQEDFPKFNLASQAKEEYLKKDKYWQVDDPEIKALAKRLGSPEDIYNFLVKNFKYNYKRLDEQAQRQGASWALKNPEKLICMEFTDLFITLTRALGIPAREANGYAYTTNSKLRPLSLKVDMLHAWPQYYDEAEQIWISVDPTWGNTTGGLDFFNKLDLDHFAFVSRGISSQYPLPAGAYKLEEANGKDIQVEFGENFDFAPKSQVWLNMPSQIKAGLVSKGEIVIDNPSPLAIYQESLKISYSYNGGELQTYEIPFNVLPPFAQEKIPVDLASSLISLGGNFQITAEFNREKIDKSVIIKPFLTEPIRWSFALTSGILIFLLLNRLILWRKKKKV